MSYDDKLIKILERLGKRHLPAQLTRLRRAIAVEATAYRKAKDELAAEAARRRHLQAGYLEDELDERGWPTREAHQALVKRQRIADRDKALANGVPEDEIAIDADGNLKPGRRAHRRPADLPATEPALGHAPRSPQATVQASPAASHDGRASRRTNSHHDKPTNALTDSHRTRFMNDPG